LVTNIFCGDKDRVVFEIAKKSAIFRTCSIFDGDNLFKVKIEDDFRPG